jgi:hypothetical protein
MSTARAPAIFKIFADNPPLIAIALGGILLLFGYLMKERELINAGLVFFFAGVGLQCYFFLFTGSSQQTR